MEAQAQAPDIVWTYQYTSPGSDYVTDMVQTDDEGIVLVIEGQRESSSGNLTKLIKLDENGNEVWVRVYDTLGMGKCRGCVKTEDGGFLLVGGPYIYLLRTDREGIPLWTRQHDFGMHTSCAMDIVHTLDGNFALLTDQNYLLKINSVGDTLWMRRHYEPVFEVVQKELAATSDGGFMYCFTPLNEAQVGVVKADSNGVLEWMTIMGTQNGEFPRNLEVMPDGGCIVSGEVEISELQGIYTLAARLDSNGDSLWMYVDDESQGGLGNCRVLNDETILITGIRYVEETLFHVSLTGITYDGTTIWDTTFALGTSQGGLTLSIVSDNVFYVGGFYSTGPVNPPDIWAARCEFTTPVHQTPKMEFLTVQNLSIYPNPFNNTVSIEFNLNRADYLSIGLYDVLGRFVIDMGSGSYTPGNYVRHLEVSYLPSGNYICKLHSRNGGVSKTITLIK